MAVPKGRPIRIKHLARLVSNSGVPAKPTPPPEIASRADFRVGNRVSCTDQHRVGLTVRINQRTATLDCDGQTWRVGFGLLRPLVAI